MRVQKVKFGNVDGSARCSSSEESRAYNNVTLYNVRDRKAILISGEQIRRRKDLWLQKDNLYQCTLDGFRGVEYRSTWLATTGFSGEGYLTIPGNDIVILGAYYTSQPQARFCPADTLVFDSEDGSECTGHPLVPLTRENQGESYFVDADFPIMLNKILQHNFDRQAEVYACGSVCIPWRENDYYCPLRIGTPIIRRDNGNPPPRDLEIPYFNLRSQKLDSFKIRYGWDYHFDGKDYIGKSAYVKTPDVRTFLSDLFRYATFCAQENGIPAPRIVQFNSTLPEIYHVIRKGEEYTHWVRTTVWGYKEYVKLHLMNLLPGETAELFNHSVTQFPDLPGYLLFYKLEGGRYHLTLINKENPSQEFEREIPIPFGVDLMEELLENAKKMAVSLRRKYLAQSVTAEFAKEVILANPTVIMTREDSTDSGNCGPGTDDWCTRNNIGQEISFEDLAKHPQFESFVWDSAFRRALACALIRLDLLKPKTDLEEEVVPEALEEPKEPEEEVSYW
jgi:hypothetical protein